MKHHRLVSKTPQTSQTGGNFQAKIDFKGEFVGQMVEVVFTKTS